MYFQGLPFSVRVSLQIRGGVLTMNSPSPPHDRRLPAEWEPQSGVQLTWPHPDSDWGPWLDAVERTYVEIVRAIADRERVLIAASDAGQVNSLLRRAKIDRSKIQIYEVPSNDTWARDHGPITIYEDESAVLLDFAFNGWGGKFPADRDNLITRRLYEAGAFGRTRMRSLDFVLEGGSIESDGAGTLLTTSQCLLTSTRNSGLTRDQIEMELCEVLGMERVLWLDHGFLAGDDTDSHIDTLARFCDSTTIAYVTCADPVDEHYSSLKEMEQELKSLRTRDGAPYRLVGLPMPTPCYDAAGNRLPATYANFLIVNGAVLVPAYGGPEDDEALTILTGCFADREVLGIPCRTLIEQHGSLHCVTMQLPEGVLV